jgi:hypothetical protein
MTWSCVVVAGVVCVMAETATVAADPPRVRPLGPIATLAVDRGRQQSARFRALVGELESSDMIVHIVATPSMPLGIIGTMRFVARLGDTRYIRIDLAAMAPPDLRVATLAHELQHACEVARSHAGSHAAVRLLYRAIGREVPGSRDAYETDGAQHIGAEVWAELRSRRTARATDQ